MNKHAIPIEESARRSGQSRALCATRGDNWISAHDAALQVFGRDQAVAAHSALPLLLGGFRRLFGLELAAGQELDLVLAPDGRVLAPESDRGLLDAESGSNGTLRLVIGQHLSGSHWPIL